MDKHLATLLNKYHHNTCTKEEIQLLEAWFEEIAKDQAGQEPHQQLIDNMQAAIKRSPRFAAKPAANWLSLKTVAGRYRAIAASLVLACTVAAIAHQYLGLSTETHLASEILPAANNATLTLADGTAIVLNDQAGGLISRQDGVTISKNEQGLLVYTVAHHEQSAPGATHTLTTARGGSFQVILPDGSQAWLNAASSLSYPLAFGKHARNVSMTGEVYFDIAKSYHAGTNEPVPFIVETAKQTIQVLGTQFNVNSYSDNPMEQTTLVEGKVKVTARATGATDLLNPNMQAHISDKLTVMEADVTRNTAWKNGDFIFRDEPLSAILKEMMRWYDVDIVCPANLGHIRFNGMVSRQQPLSAVINMIAITEKVKLEVKGRRIIVTE